MMHHWKLERTGDKPIVIEAERLVPEDPPGPGYNENHPETNWENALFLTKGGRYILHIANRHVSYGGVTRTVHLDVDTWTDQAIIQTMGNVWLAKDVLLALGRTTEERID